MYTAIFVSIYLLAWGTLSFLPWLGLSIATRGRAGLWMLPLCLFAGVTAALVVPLAGATGWGGLWGSLVVAFLVPAGLLAASRLARLPGLDAETDPARAPRP
jgi:hypothetical protein